jgi:hypothetical protein
MPTKKKRMFLSKEYTKKTFLVFYCENIEKPKRSSCGLYENKRMAYEAMNDYLINGLCSWVVVYNG